MQNLKSILKSILLLATVALIAVGCSKDEKDPVVEEQNLSQTEVKTILAADDFSKSFDNIISTVYFNDSNSGKSNECYVTTYTDTGFSISFDNCTLDGVENVTGTLSAVYTSVGDTISYTVTWDNVVYGDMTIAGTRDYTISSETQGAVVFTVTSNMTMTEVDGSVVAETGARDIAFTIGDSFENTTYSISGNWTVTADGNTYKVTVVNDLEGNLACAYLVYGVMDVEKNGLEVTVDLGNGECDDKAIVEYPDGTEEEISLKD